MNREIKFRAWDTKREVFSDACYEFDCDGSVVVDPDCIIMQFTGLHDRNDKPIYEGDLIKEVDQFARTYEAKWYDNGWSLSIEPYHNRHFKDAAHMEIVGNIYENPELLKEA